jgi:hypothetical protein
VSRAESTTPTDTHLRLDSRSDRLIEVRPYHN